MCRDELVRYIAERTREKQSTVKAVIEALTDITAEALAKGESVSIREFGVFELKSRSPRIGRNPHTGQAVEVPARSIPHFKPSDVLKSRISGDGVSATTSGKSLRTSPPK